MNRTALLAQRCFLLCLIWCGAHAFSLMGQVAPPADSGTAPEAAPEMTPGEERPETPGVATLGAAGGEDYFEGRLDLLYPLLPVFDDRGLFLGVLRGTWADEGEQEFNAGLVYRHDIGYYDALVGANIFYDSRWTREDSRFDQLGLGLEWLSPWVDARANLYLPENRRELLDRQEETVLIGQVDRVTYQNYAVGHQIHEKEETTRTETFRTDLYEVYESPRRGWDAEVGVRFPLPQHLDDLQLRGFVGYYDFEPKWSGNAGPDNEASGMKARLELRAWDCLYLDAEWFEDDNLYGTDYLVGMRLRLPLGSQAFRKLKAGPATWFDGQKARPPARRRMTDMVMRDPQIQVRNGVELTQSLSSQTRSLPSRDRLLMDNVLFVYGDNPDDPSENGTAEHPFDRVQEGVDESAARAWPDVYVFGSSAPYRENVTVRDNLRLRGEGAPLGRAAPPTRGFGRPVIEGQPGTELLTPGVLDIRAPAETVRVTGFEITAAPFAGGDWTRPSAEGTLSPLAGIYAQDVATLTVDHNRIRDLPAGVVSLYGPVENFELDVFENRFENLGLGVGALFDVGGRVRIADNDLNRTLLGIGVIGAAMDTPAQVDILGNRIVGRTVDLARIEPFALYQDLFSELLPAVPGFPGDHPETLPFPALAGVAVVAAPGADIDARVIGNQIRHPALGIAGLAISPNLLGADLPYEDALTRLDWEVRDNLLIGGGLDSLYRLGRAHAGTLGALFTGNYGNWTAEETEDFGDNLRAMLPESLGFDMGLLGIGSLALGEGAEMNRTIIAGNHVEDFAFGIATLAGMEGKQRGATVADNSLRRNLLGISGIAVAGGQLRRMAVLDNRLEDNLLGIAGLSLLDGNLRRFEVGGNDIRGGMPWLSQGLLGELLGDTLAPLGDYDPGIGGILLLAADARAREFNIHDNRISRQLVGIGAIGLGANLSDGTIANNRIDRSLAGIVGLGIGARMNRLRIAGNEIRGGGLRPLASLLTGGGNLPFDGDAGLLGIGLAGISSPMDDFEIVGNRLASHVAGIGILGLDESRMRHGIILDNRSVNHGFGILALAADDSNLRYLTVNNNTLHGAGLDLLTPLLWETSTQAPLHDIGIAGVTLLAVNGGRIRDAVLFENTIERHAVGLLAAGLDESSTLRGLTTWNNTLEKNAFGVLLAGVNGANLNDIVLFQNRISDSLVGVLASASRVDSFEARTPMDLLLLDNTIQGSDSMLVEGMVSLSLASILAGNGAYGFPTAVLGLDELLAHPADLLEVFPGLDAVLPGGFDELNPPSLGDVLESPNFAQLLNGQGLAGVLLHFDESAPGSGAILIENTIANMENGIYAVVTDPDDLTEVDLILIDNESQDNWVIGEDTTGSDYNVIEAGAPLQEPVGFLPSAP